jgi:formamidopyrimidine-DNA glycosylase
LPEGDTLRRLVRLLTPDLAGRTLVAGRLRRDPSLNLSGLQVTKVHALGKHL